MNETARTPGDASRGVVKQVYIEAEDATVFSYFTDPAKMARWMGIDHKIDPRPGGVYEVQVTPRSRGRGEYKEVSPNHRVVFSWGWIGEDAVVKPGSTLVTIELTPKPPGTLVTLTHSGLWGEAAASHAVGWEHYLARLEIAAAGGDPGPDPWCQPGTTM